MAIVPGTAPPPAGAVPDVRQAAAPRLAECLSDLAALHRHVCPRQVLGVRMGLHAGALLGVELPRRDKRLFAFIETDGCVTDAVSVATGCWLGHRTLRLVDHGKIAATIVDTQTGAAVRVWPHPASRARAREMVPDAHDRWHAQLEGYQRMAVEDLLCAEPVALTIDLDAIRSRPGRRVTCERCHEEVINEREVQRGGAAVCLGCSGERYYTAGALGRLPL